MPVVFALCVDTRNFRGRLAENAALSYCLLVPHYAVPLVDHGHQVYAGEPKVDNVMIAVRQRGINQVSVDNLVSKQVKLLKPVSVIPVVGNVLRCRLGLTHGV